MSNAPTTTRERALQLLGQGVQNSVVAAALGVTDSVISQLLAEPQFAAEVAALRYQNLTAATKIDAEYNDMEGELLKKLRRNLPLIQKPGEILKAIQVVNGAKRRGAQAVDQQSVAAKVVQISLPKVIHNTYITNVNNQVVEVQDGTGAGRTLVTVDSEKLESMAREREATRRLEYQESGVSETITPERLSKLPSPKNVSERFKAGSANQAELTGQALADFL